jgi:para-aminobenzoate synthetase component 1
MRPRLLRHPLGGGLDAATAFRSLYDGRSDVFWLDSGGEGTSYLGAGRPLALERPVLAALRDELAAVGPSIETDPDADGDAPLFRLGLVGWLGYEVRGETTGIEPVRASRYPDAGFLRVDRALAIDRAGNGELLALGTEWEDELAEWRDDVIRTLAAPPGPLPPLPVGSVARWHDADPRYLENVRSCLDAIREGEAYQLCLTTEVEVDGVFDPLAVYLALRETSGTHHGGLIRIGAVSLLSASPERFLDVAPDGLVRTRPIKGTRPRGGTPDADARLAADLLASEKERAENLMIVDLMRNDLSRVCEVGSVAVTRLLAVESYAHVHQLVSTVEGRLLPGRDAIDAIGACFPAGSMTGAPKLRATELLDELEQRPRGIYAGTFGYLGFDGRADLAMTIRSIVLDEKGATVGAGGGITALSVPEEELAEAHLKAAALLGALGVHDPVAETSAAQASVESNA